MPRPDHVLCYLSLKGAVWPTGTPGNFPNASENRGNMVQELSVLEISCIDSFVKHEVGESKS